MSRIERVLSKREFLMEWTGLVWRDGKELVAGLGYEDLERGDEVRLKGTPDHHGWYEIGYICSKGLELTTKKLINWRNEKMIKIYRVIEEDLKTNDSWIMYEGVSLKEANDTLEEDYIFKGYIAQTLVENMDELETNENLFLSDDDPNCKIIKTKGW